MTFNCTLVAGPGSPRVQPPMELSVDAPRGTDGSVVHEQLARKFGVGVVTVEGKDLRTLVLGVPPLVEASILVDGGTSPSRRSTRRKPGGESEPHLALTIDSGAAAGTVVPLQRGSYSIGRCGTRIVIPDPELSREHARLDVTETDIVLIDLDSANGTYVNGERIRSAVISTESKIRCGQSKLSLSFSEVPRGVLADAGKSVSEPIVVSGRIDTGNRAMFLVTAVLPLVIGLLLAVLTGMWMFLAFSAASAFSVLLPALSGRRQRRELSASTRAAVQEDRKRRRRCAPPLSLLTLAAQRATEKCGGPSGGESVWLRLGEAEQAPNVRIEPAGIARIIPPPEVAPVLLDPERPLTTLGGPPFATDGVIRSLLMQLAGYPLASTTQVLLHGHPETLPLAARYLSGVTLTATTNACLSVVNSPRPRGCDRAILLIRGESSATTAENSIREAALEHGWQVLHFLPEEGGWPAPDVLLSERGSLLPPDLPGTVFVPDLVPEEVFTSFCRHMAGVQPQEEESVKTVPGTCSLNEILSCTPAATAERWNASEQDDKLAVPVGLGAHGRRFVDLHADGPHLLLAGTTGSGKSELLRSLTLALALSYPPERVNFFFIDFKGGSGLGPLSDLVHCVGLQTDLSTAEMERTLTSLRAEVRLRERRLSAARVPDVSAYRSTAAAAGLVLPHLVIVIDEFRMLVDDAPEVLRELLRIASIGRSLGIHLVMATQRPQGALTADIRANVTSSIALRVQSEMESVDVVNCKSAAAIGVDSPGRAFLARGTEAAEEFQAATLASTDGQDPAAVEVHRTTDYLARQVSTPARAPTSGPTPAQAVEPLAALVQNLCAMQEKQAPRRPVAPPLPEEPEEPASGELHKGTGAPASCELESLAVAGEVRLGLMDVPDEQRLEALVWSPARHGHAAFIGSPASGVGAALELTVHKLMGHPLDAHFYILDAPGSFLPLAASPRTGAHAGLHDLRRGVRILERLVRELGERLADPASFQVPLVLVISGWGSWVSAFRSGPLAWAEDLVQDLVRDGARVGITLLLSGERELLTARFFGGLPNRFYFPAESTEETRAMWPRMPAVAAVKGRAAAFGPVAYGGPFTCQFYRNLPASPAGSKDAGQPIAASSPFRVEPLPARITAEQVAALTGRASVQPSPALPRSAQLAPAARCQSPQPQRIGRKTDILLGVTGDELAPASFRVRPGGVVAVLGRPGSGRSNALHALTALNPEQLWRVCPVRPDAAEGYVKDLVLEAEAGGLPQEAVLLVDDIDLLSPPAVKNLGQLNALGFTVVAAAVYSPLLLQRVPLVMNARAAGVGLLLGPRSAADGDLFGVRFEVESNCPPGRGVLISNGSSCPVQVAWAGADARLRSL